jgi:predicted DNA-binding protein (MmcQ/YjbR family)
VTSRRRRADDGGDGGDGRVDHAADLAHLLAHALTYPEAWEDHPWGDSVVKVRRKIFVFLGIGDDGALQLSTKLPESADQARSLPWCEPTGYGLGRAGWTTARLAPDVAAPLPLLEDWIDESYRAVAPRTLVRTLDGRAP